MGSKKLSFGIKTSQQCTTYEDVARIWHEADAMPIIEHAWLFDHFMPIIETRIGPCMEGWSLLAALAAQTQRVRIGVMVTGVTYRHPALLATVAATIDLISHGRLDFGIGAAWNEREHLAYLEQGVRDRPCAQQKHPFSDFLAFGAKPEHERRRLMAYRTFTHIALLVSPLRQAEEFYRTLFALEVAFREAETANGWDTLPSDAGWDDAEAAGISLGLCSLHRDAFTLALEEGSSSGGGRLSHIGVQVDAEDLSRLRTVAPTLGCQVVQDGHELREVSPFSQRRLFAIIV